MGCDKLERLSTDMFISVQKNKKLLKEWKSNLNWKQEPYPKGDNSNYKLGDYYKPTVLDSSGNIVEIKEEVKKSEDIGIKNSLW